LRYGSGWLADLAAVLSGTETVAGSKGVGKMAGWALVGDALDELERHRLRDSPNQMITLKALRVLPASRRLGNDVSID
jgi:hypothetical protein